MIFQLLLNFYFLQTYRNFFWGKSARGEWGWLEWVGGGGVHRLFYNVKQRLKYLTLTWGDPLAIFAISIIKQCPTLKLVTGRP